jgi:hypothetical protein
VIVPSSAFRYDAGNHCFFARKSDLGADFHFSSINCPESDVGFGLRLDRTGDIFVFYLARTLEVEGKVTEWEFRVLPRYGLSIPAMRAFISND